MKSVRKNRLLDVWNVDATLYKANKNHGKKIRKQVRDLKEYFDFLQQWPQISPSKKGSERVNKPFVL